MGGNCMLARLGSARNAAARLQQHQRFMESCCCHTGTVHSGACAVVLCSAQDKELLRQKQPQLQG